MALCVGKEMGNIIRWNAVTGLKFYDDDDDGGGGDGGGSVCAQLHYTYARK
jgi:hypothetical protein